MPTTRPPLSRATVVAAAVRAADEQGLAAVSMRSLAESLRVVPMALYKHVCDKEDLLDAMVDAVIGEFDIPPADAERAWQDQMRAALWGARRAVLAHPWVRSAIESRTARTPSVLGHMESVTNLCLRAGFTPDLTHHAMHALGSRIWGFSPELFPGAPEGVRDGRGRPGPPDPDDYPGILAIAADAARRRPNAQSCDEDFEFDFALNLVLDGIERLRATEWNSSASGRD